jgi:hypothetical protein
VVGIGALGEVVSVVPGMGGIMGGIDFAFVVVVGKFDFGFAFVAGKVDFDFVAGKVEFAGKVDFDFVAGKVDVDFVAGKFDFEFVVGFELDWVAFGDWGFLLVALGHTGGF